MLEESYTPPLSQEANCEEKDRAQCQYVYQEHIQVTCISPNRYHP